MPPKQKCRKDPIHGNIYQLKLLMLFLYQGIRHKYFFRLGTEIPEANKFDDIVFGYAEDDGEKFRLLQAKHRIDKSKKIKAGDLLTNSDSDFSLTKYYFSYHDSKSEKLFKAGSIKDIIICTNIDFDLSDLEKAGITLEPVKESDPILDINNIEFPISKKPVRYKINPQISTKLKSIIENSFIPKLVKKVVFFLLNNKTISKEGYLFSQYQFVLRKEVIDVENKRFKEDFINGNKLSEDAEKFRFLLHNEILIKSKGKIQLGDLNDAIIEKKTINEKTIGLAVRRDFGKGMTPDDAWPEIPVSIDYINEYLDALVFAVNQLDEEELGQIIMKEMGNQFNTITTEYMYNKIFQYMLKWMQGKDANGKRKGHSMHSWKEGKRLIDDARKEILNCLAPDCKQTLDSVPFSFNKHIKVETFLASKHGIWLLPSESPWLSTLVVYHSVKNIPNRSNFFFKWQNAISSKGKIISYFHDLDEFLVVLTCNQIINAEDIREDLSLTMKKISNSGTSKKVIIITPINEDLRNTLKHKFQIDYESRIKIEFSNLDDTSQKKFLRNKNIIFNGNCEKLCLNELLCCNTPIENFALDARELESLLRNSEVKVWTVCPQQFNSSCINYKANEIVSSIQIREAIQVNKNDIFAFLVSQNDAQMLITKEIKLQEFLCTELSNLLKTHHFFFMNDGKEREEFDLLCQVAGNVCELKPSIHMLKSLGKDEWLWIETYNPDIYIQRYFKRNLLSRTVMQSICSSQSCQFIIFSGMMKNELFNLLPEKYRSHENFYNCKVLISEENAEEEFKRMKQQYEEEVNGTDRDFTNNVSDSLHSRGVHWVKVWEEEGNLMLEWYKSFGNRSNITNYLAHKDSHGVLLREDRLIELKQRVIVLSDNPGMGKSSSLNRLAEHLKKTNPLSIVIKLDLNDNQEKLTQLHEYTKSKLVRTLLNIKPNTKQSSLSGKILEHKLEYLKQVIILCDAFDEVIEDKQKDLLKWFDFVLKNTKASIWITTRPNNKEKLEKHFSVISYFFKELKKPEQIDYLNRFWKMSLTFSSGVNKNVSSSIANKVTEHFKSVLVKKEPESFVQIPLMLRMLAEKYVEIVRDISMNDIQDDSTQVPITNCLNTYESFIDHVFEIYFFYKLKTIKWLDNDSKVVLKKSYSKAYGYLALKHICERQLRDPVLYLGKKKESICLNTLSKIGLIQSHGGPITKSMFIHSFFEEFFAVSVVFDKCISNPESSIWWEFLLNVTLMNPFSRRIFDDKLQNRGILFPNVKAVPIIYQILKQQVRSKSKQVALWIAAADGLKRTVTFLSKFMMLSEMVEILKLKKDANSYVQFQEILKSSLKNDDNEALEKFIIERGSFLSAGREAYTKFSVGLRKIANQVLD